MALRYTRTPNSLVSRLEGGLKMRTSPAHADEGGFVVPWRGAEFRTHEAGSNLIECHRMYPLPATYPWRPDHLPRTRPRIRIIQDDHGQLWSDQDRLRQPAVV